MNEMAFPAAAAPRVTTWCNFLHDFPDYYEESTVAPDHFADVAGVNVLPQQPLSLMKQSNDTTRADVAIPAEVQAIYATYRPTLLRRAHRLEERLGTTARIYYKYEGANVSGSHKLNSAIAQAYYYKKAGVKHLITGTGAGQWGTALAYACKQFGLALHRVHGRHQLPPEAAAPHHRRAVRRRDPREPEPAHQDRARRDEARPGPHRLARRRHRRGDRDGARDEGLGALRGGQRRDLRPPPPDRDRQRGGRPDAGARRFPRLRRRLHGRRQQLRRRRHALPPRGKGDGTEDRAGRRRAGRLPETHPRRLPLRHQRFLRHHAGDPDVHAGEPLPRPRHPCRRAPLPRHLGIPLRALRPQGILGPRHFAARRARRRHPLRRLRRDHPGAGVGPRHRRRDRDRARAQDAARPARS